MYEQQLEEQKTQNQKEPQPLSEDKGATSALPESITLAEDMTFQPQMAPDFTQAFSDQFQNISAEKEKSFLLPDNVTPSIVNRMFFKKNINYIQNLIKIKSMEHIKIKRIK